MNKSGVAKAIRFANVCKVLAVVVVILGIIGAVCGFAMNGFINGYYENPDNIATAAQSLDADMGIFGVLPFDSIKAAGNYGVFFGLQLLCMSVCALVYVYLFGTIRKTLQSIYDTGRAFSDADAAKAKTRYVILTMIMLLFKGAVAAAVTGLVLCGLYAVTLGKEE